MKRYLLTSVMLLTAQLLWAQTKIGDVIAPVRIPVLLNAPVRSTDLGQLKGKVILLEFWATWCSPCVAAMPHLQELQKNYQGKLQVVTVTTEKAKRIGQFLVNKPSNLWFAIDSADAFRKDFPYHTIPHSVLINAKGIVVAITQPGNITTKVIDSALKGQALHLPLKEDNMNQDPWATYFSVDPGVRNLFSVQPKVEGVFSGAKYYNNDSTFHNRRISMMNIPLEGAYRIAYGDLPYGRVIDLTAKENLSDKKTMYCIDIIVPRGREAALLPTLQKELKSRFALQAVVEQRLKPVYILGIGDTAKARQLKLSKAIKENFGASHGAFSGEGVSLKKIADYLEGFGLVDMPVVDETGDNKKYDIDFNYMPEKKGDLQNTLQNLGFKLSKGERNINMLVFRTNDAL